MFEFLVGGWGRSELGGDKDKVWCPLGVEADACCPPGKPTLYGSVTRRGLSSDGVPDIVASEGFVVGEVTKVPGLGGEGLVSAKGAALAA